MPINLDDLDPDARAMAEAAAKAAGISASEWISRIVLARAGPAGHERAIPAQEPSPPADPPASEPVAEASTTELDPRDQSTAAERTASHPGTTEIKQPADTAGGSGDEPTGADPSTADGAPAAGFGRVDAMHPDREPAVDVRQAVHDGTEPQRSEAALSVAFARGTHAPLSVDADTSTIVSDSIEDRSAIDHAAQSLPDDSKAEVSPTESVVTESAVTETTATAAERVQVGAEPQEPEAPADGDGSRPFIAAPDSATEGGAPRSLFSRSVLPAAPAIVDVTIAAPAPSDPGSAPATTEPTRPPAIAGRPERHPDLSRLFVETGAGEAESLRGSRWAIILGGIILSVVTAAAWLHLAPTFDVEGQLPFKLPLVRSVLKAPDEVTPARPDEAAANASAADAPSPDPAAMTAPSNAPIDEAQQLAALKTVAERGDGAAQHDLAVRYASGDGAAQDYREAARWFRAAALQGIANAQYNLGVLTERGLGVEQNAPMALLWYLAAAGKGHSAAEYNIGLVYAEGKGVDANPIESMKWFQRAAERGFTKAQYNLGVMHEQGAANAINLVEAYRWYRLAASGGDGGAEARLAELTARMSRGEIDKAEELARQPLNPPAVQIGPAAAEPNKP